MRIIVSAPALAVVAALQRHVDVAAPVSIPDLADRTGYKPNTVWKALRELDELGAIALVHDEHDGRRPVRTAVLRRDHWVFTAATQLGGSA